eukprot:g19716.t1
MKPSMGLGASSMIWLVLCLAFQVSARQYVWGSVCYNQQCFQGYNCKCECGGGKGVVFLYGNCNQCSVGTCQSALPTICSSQVNSTQCNINCASNEMNDDGNCHEFLTSRDESLYYTLTCIDKGSYRLAVSKTCNITEMEKTAFN